jgi:hypothetical protein
MLSLHRPRQLPHLRPRYRLFRSHADWRVIRCSPVLCVAFVPSCFDLMIHLSRHLQTDRFDQQREREMLLLPFFKPSTATIAQHGTMVFGTGRDPRRCTAFSCQAPPKLSLAFRHVARSYTQGQYNKSVHQSNQLSSLNRATHCLAISSPCAAAMRYHISAVLRHLDRAQPSDPAHTEHYHRPSRRLA